MILRYGEIKVYNFLYDWYYPCANDSLLYGQW